MRNNRGVCAMKDCGLRCLAPERLRTWRRWLPDAQSVTPPDQAGPRYVPPGDV